MRINPVIEKELKTKMRGWKSPALITAYLGFLGLFVFFYFLANNQLSRYNLDYFNPRIALNAYNALATVQFLLIIFITPAMTAAAISGERERQTLDLLLCTNIKTFSIITGKLFVSIMHILLLITASLPIMGVVFMFGGVGIKDLLLLFAFYLTVALMIGSIGIFYSTIFKKSSVSIVMTYITVMALLVGTIIGLVLWLFILNGFGTNVTPSSTEIMVFMSPNPLYGFSSLIGSGGSRGALFFVEIFFELRRYMNIPDNLKFLTEPWMLNIIFNLVSSLVLILFASWKIKPVKKRLFKFRFGKSNPQNRKEKVGG